MYGASSLSMFLQYTPYGNLRPSKTAINLCGLSAGNPRAGNPLLATLLEPTASWETKSNFVAEHAHGGKQ
jgi:hypothetical protein